MNADQILQKLDEMGYFKWTEKDKLEDVKSRIKDTYKAFKTLDSAIDEDVFASDDRRIWLADAENLAEGGMPEVLTNMKDILEKEGITIESVEDDYDENNNYFLVINKKHYKIGEAGNWDTAFQKFIEILNQLFKSSGSKEKAFGQYGGNDARIIFLTDEMYNFLKTLDLDKEWMSYRSSDKTEKS